MQEFTIKQTILDYRSKEAFKTLRTNIEFSGEDTKVIFLTSTIPVSYTHLTLPTKLEV